MNNFELEFQTPIPQLKSRFKKVNPMVIKYGPKAGRTCKTCKHIFVGGSGSRGYYKCRLRGNTSGPGTDHLLNWEACGQFKSEQTK